MSGTGYVKIFGSILGSSVWAEAPATRIVWITMLALADAQGHVEASVSGLARFANVSPRQCAAALEILAAPDPDSKSPAHEGRRIEKAERGWMILNYLAYRELQSPKQIADAARAQEYRDRKTAERLAALEDERDASQTSAHVATTVDVEEAVAVKSSSSSFAVRENALACRLETDADRMALTAICAKVAAPPSWIAEASATLDGLHGVMLTPKQLGEALREYVGNGALANPNFRHFRAYLRRAAAPERAPPAGVDPANPFGQWADATAAKEKKNA